MPPPHSSAQRDFIGQRAPLSRPSDTIDQAAKPGKAPLILVQMFTSSRRKQQHSNSTEQMDPPGPPGPPAQGCWRSSEVKRIPPGLARPLLTETFGNLR